MSERQRVGLIGLGRMGLQLAQNLSHKGYSVLGYDLSETNRQQLRDLKMETATSLPEFAATLASPRVIILSVPAGDPVESVISGLDPHLVAGDVVIDGGNSHYLDSIRRSGRLSHRGIGFLDVGISGGINGARHGACVTVGGDPQVFKGLEHLFRDISQVDGYMYVGPSGWGHLVKTVHNGIEYGFLQALGEGLALLKELSDREGVSIDLSSLCSAWNHGSIISSRLLGDAADALKLLVEHPEISGSIGGGETGQWAKEIALKADVPVPALDAALAYRKCSRPTDFTGKVVSAIRHVFGGHHFRK